MRVATWLGRGVGNVVCVVPGLGRGFDPIAVSVKIEKVFPKSEYTFYDHKDGTFREYFERILKKLRADPSQTIIIDQASVFKMSEIFVEFKAEILDLMGVPHGRLVVVDYDPIIHPSLRNKVNVVCVGHPDLQYVVDLLRAKIGEAFLNGTEQLTSAEAVFNDLRDLTPAAIRNVIQGADSLEDIKARAQSPQIQARRVPYQPLRRVECYTIGDNPLRIITNLGWEGRLTKLQRGTVNPIVFDLQNLSPEKSGLLIDALTEYLNRELTWGVSLLTFDFSLVAREQWHALIHPDAIEGIVGDRFRNRKVLVEVKGITSSVDRDRVARLINKHRPNSLGIFFVPGVEVRAVKKIEERERSSSMALNNTVRDALGELAEQMVKAEQTNAYITKWVGRGLKIANYLANVVGFMGIFLRPDPLVQFQRLLSSPSLADKLVLTIGFIVAMGIAYGIYHFEISGLAHCRESAWARVKLAIGYPSGSLLNLQALMMIAPLPSDSGEAITAFMVMLVAAFLLDFLGDVLEADADAAIARTRGNARETGHGLVNPGQASVESSRGGGNGSGLREPTDEELEQLEELGTRGLKCSYPQCNSQVGTGTNSLRRVNGKGFIACGLHLAWLAQATERELGRAKRYEFT